MVDVALASEGGPAGIPDGVGVRAEHGAAEGEAESTSGRVRAAGAGSVAKFWLDTVTSQAMQAARRPA